MLSILDKSPQKMLNLRSDQLESLLQETNDFYSLSICSYSIFTSFIYLFFFIFYSHSYFLTDFLFILTFLL
jgi:hypothetical protein